ncbi:autotransporter domain-containing protein [Chlamydia suis]|uniref:polymorphic outer membrane protein middle domain-containing protein n=1 Tax=Chlamydia suis TaxID=83559 RepID=UPI0009AF526B|nr:polymorphic outer membrane protein middle domain-containing protein [Chlamydia suis]QYC71315.1 autotransporter domain-containing protein [Chlamydia suis]QYC72209.1 autotransporter domain-containing protein [Chlamydia suis]QYC73104.1 autotransporter domain-containing protein [Chlamydia suis]QYC78542.1 autotransporter domain-containing protein [Chlamydia suis]QYC79508.1 autotransporter domain-containing protein [Chlamydia suis]
MQTPFHKFFLSIILSYSICCSLEGHAADITVPQGIYDGETLTAPFPYTVIGDPSGTTVVPAGNLILKNLDNSIAALPLSCFGNLSGNFTIDGKGYSLTFENIRTATNGAALSNSAVSGLFIVQDFNELLFLNCNSLLSALSTAGQPQTTTPTPSSGTIYSKTDLILKNIQNFSFYSNLVSGDGGAVDAQSLTIQGVKKLCVFQENTAQSDGGACQVTKNFLATDNPAPVAFIGNVAGIKGGGLAAVKDGQNGQTPGPGTTADLSVSFSKNTAVEFDGNVARMGGGIYSDGPISFLENAKTVFLNNVAAPVYIDPSQPPQGGGGQQPPADKDHYGDGGAIFCKNGTQPQGTAASGEISFKGEGMVFFSKNVAAGKGGAIYAKKLSISDCGPVQFIGNIANDGGAIYLEASGELSLSADHGDIIFDANLKRTAQQNATTVNDVQMASNAISMAAGGTVSTLRASEGHQILFNDPIVMANGQNQTQTLKVNDGEGYSGDIVFAKGESVLYSDIELAQGKILLREKAKLSVRSLNQTGGIVCMEAGTTLDFVNGAQQPQPAKPISLTNLHLSLASLLESSGVTNPPTTPPAQTSTPAVIGNTNNGSVTITGPIFFEDLDNTSYDKYEWLGANQTLDVLKLQVGTQPPANTPADLTLGSENPQYGYQGNWELQWVPDPAQPPQNNSYTLKATWTKTGYNPGPERVASLVPNSLWGSIFDVRSAHSAIQASIDGRAYCRGLWISGISNFFYHDRDALGQGYRHISGGYAIGANSYFGSSMFGVAFSEMFGRSKDYVVCRSNDHTCIGTVYLATKKALCGSCVFGETFMRASYGFGNQHMKTSYTFAEENDVRWDNNCLVGEIGAGLPIVIAPSKLYLNELHPFVQAEFAYADHESFTEEGDQAREFKSGHLMNLTIPVGVKFDRCSSRHPNKYSFMGAYICDAYRSISGTKTSLLSHQESWTTDAFHLGRHGAMVRGSMYASLTSNIEVYGHGRYEYRNASRGYGLSAGSKVRF